MSLGFLCIGPEGGVLVCDSDMDPHLCVWVGGLVGERERERSTAGGNDSLLLLSRLPMYQPQP